MSEVTVSQQVQRNWWDSISSGLDSVLSVGAKYAEIAQSLELRKQAQAAAVQRATPEHTTQTGVTPHDPMAGTVAAEPQNVAHQVQKGTATMISVGGMQVSGVQLALVGLGAVALYLALR